MGSRHARKAQGSGAPTPSVPPRAGRTQGGPLMHIKDAWQSARSMRAGLRKLAHGMCSDREGVGCASRRVGDETLRMAFQTHRSCVWKVSARHTARGAAHDGVETCACMLGSWLECDPRVGGACTCLPRLWVHARPAPNRAPGVARRAQSHPRKLGIFNAYIPLIYIENHH